MLWDFCVAWNCQEALLVMVVRDGRMEKPLPQVDLLHLQLKRRNPSLTSPHLSAHSWKSPKNKWRNIWKGCCHPQTNSRVRMKYILWTSARANSILNSWKSLGKSCVNIVLTRRILTCYGFIWPCVPIKTRAPLWLSLSIILKKGFVLNYRRGTRLRRRRPRERHRG